MFFARKKRKLLILMPIALEAANFWIAWIVSGKTIPWKEDL